MAVTSIKRGKATVFRDADPDGHEMLRVIFRPDGPRVMVSEQLEQLLRGEEAAKVRGWVDDSIKAVLDGIMKLRRN